MFPKALAILVVFSWIVVSSYDLLEDLDFSVHSKVKSSKTIPPNTGTLAKLTNDSLEHSSQPLTSPAGSLGPGLYAVALRLYQNEFQICKKDLRLHKLHCTFLI
jgi:hypothetical protein